MKKLLKIGTRASKLALWQANYVKEFLIRNFTDVEVILKEIITTGDANSEDAIESFGGKNIFVKEIEQALISKEIDLAVHSYKDLPAQLPEGLEIISTSNREDPRDVLVSKSNKALLKLSDNPKIGTGSLRRSEQLIHIRKDVSIIPIRGNVDTRIRKSLDTDIDGVVLANAGIRRLGLSNYVSELFDIDVIVPSPLQGFLAIEAREDTDLTKYFEHFSSEESVLVSNYERQFLKDLNLGCQYPAGFCMQVHKENKFSFNYFLKGTKKEVKNKEVFSYSDLLTQYSKMIDTLTPII
ncbi:hydroxymethylbilane synthase [bacterium]|jgi:hydroxymethylbilane synthase|nr:hydroxymethylbilane synthase [bacterium]